MQENNKETGDVLNHTEVIMLESQAYLFSRRNLRRITKAEITRKR